MTALTTGLGVFGIIIAVVVFLIAVLVIRWIFGIGKIVESLEAISQSTTNTNAAVDEMKAILQNLQRHFLVTHGSGGSSTPSQ